VLYELICLPLHYPGLAGLGKWQHECYFTAAAQYLEDLAAFAEPASTSAALPG
jgi:hypothetical protein